MISDSSSTSLSKYSVSPAATVPPGLFMEMLLTTGGVRSSEAAKAGVDSMPITKHRERKIANSRLFMLYFLRPFSSVVFSEKILPEILLSCKTHSVSYNGQDSIETYIFQYLH